MGLVFRGVDYRTADAVERERVREELSRVVYPQCVRLFTCNRSEIYYITGAEPLRGDLINDSRRSRSAPDGMEREALTHLFRVASGLESMVLGEYQILGQVKEAYAAAKAAGTVGKELDRIFRDAISCAKRVKTELDLGAVPPSVCRAGLDLVDAWTGIAGKRVFVIGSGKTGTLAVQIAAEKGASSIAACNRSPERAQHLARDYGATIIDYTDRYAVIAKSDIVISATASPHLVVEATRLSLAHPVTFLDLAAPNDVDPSIGTRPDVTLITLETIGESIRGDRDERAELLAHGGMIVESCVQKTLAWS